MPKKGRGGGGNSSRGRGGSSRGGGLGFVPFSGHGNTLGNGGDSSQTQSSTRGGGAGGKPYRGRGRGGSLSAQGQTHVAFDYANLSRGRLPAQDDDFVIEPPATHKHKAMSHVENGQHSDAERIATPNKVPSSKEPSQAYNVSASDSPRTPYKFKRAVAPTVYPEFHTSRGSGGFKSRPPEETEDARYLAGIPGARASRSLGRPSRFDQRGDAADNILRKPVTFVKALHQPFADPLEEQHVEFRPVEESAAQAQEALQQTSHSFDPFGHSSKHAGLGFSSKTENRPQSPQPQSQPEYDFGDEMEHDEVDALLAAFPGSKQLGPEESMIPGDSTFDFSPMPSILDGIHTAPPHQGRLAEEVQDEPVLETVHVKQEPVPLPADITAPREFVESDSEEERQLDAILAQSIVQISDDEVDTHDELEPSMEDDLGFVIDLTGADTTEEVPITTGRSNRIALGDVLPPSAVQPTNLQSKVKAPKKPRKRVPREGDSDLEWGSDGPPGGDGDGTSTDGEILAPGASLSSRDPPHPQAAESISSTIQGRMLDELMLARAIRADRHEWDRSERDLISVSPAAAKTSKRGGERAKRSLVNRAAGVRQAAETSRARKEHEAAAVADYLENIMNQQDDEDDDDEVDDLLTEDAHAVDAQTSTDKAAAKSQSVLDVMTKFMIGMDPQQGGKQMSFGDVQDEINITETKEWLTESEEEDDDEPVNVDGDDTDDYEAPQITTDASGRQQISAVAARKLRIQQEFEAAADARFKNVNDEESIIEQLRLVLEDYRSESDSEIPAEDSNAEEEEEDSSSEDDDDEEEEESGSEDSDSDDSDDDMFQGKDSWADQDEDFIKALAAQMGPGKRSQKDVFKAISRGDFSDMIDDEMEIDSDDPAYGLGSVPTAKNGKRKGRKFNEDDIWGEELQKQWDKDRASKATKKQQRLMEKAAAALNPYPNTHGAKTTKKAAKQMRRAEKRDARKALKAHGNNALAAIHAAGGIDAVDPSLLAFGGRGNNLSSLGLDQRFAFNMSELNEQIQMFLGDRGKTTLTLQPMDKFARAEVHQLAAAYNLKSQSKGKGTSRFPTLIKTSQSGYNVNERKVRRIVMMNAGATFGNDSGRSDFKNKNKRQGKGATRMVGQNGGGAPAPKNRDGEQVGFGADKIGADNIGHRLLAAMGWSEGMGIGHTGGMADPVNATVKITKGGLGF